MDPVLNCLSDKESHRKFQSGALVLAFALILGSTASARSTGCLAQVTPPSNRFQPYRFFGGQTVAVPLLVHAPEPQGLSLRAQLVQLSSELKVPTGPQLEVPLPRNAALPAGIEIELAVPLPAVKRETGFELRIKSRRDAEEAWSEAGRVALRVYPRDLLGPLRRWAESQPFRVEDDHGSLVEFLRRQQIPVAGGYGTRGSGDAGRLRLYAGQRALSKGARARPREDEVIVLFSEKQTEIPYLLIERIGPGTVVTVEMRLIDRLATDPMAQKTLLEVFEIVHGGGIVNRR